jgi:hypothetical protein
MRNSYASVFLFKIRIIFVSPGGTQPVINRRGFKLRYEFTPEYMISAMPSVYNDPNNNYIQECGGQNRADELSGIIKSPGFPKTYPKVHF